MTHSDDYADGWKRVSKSVEPFCAPIWWWRKRRRDVLANATMCFVRTATTLFGVTSEHVLQIYEKHRRDHSEVVCQLASGPFEPVDNVIDRSEAWDLATFRIPAATIARIGGGRKPFVHPAWPPRAMDLTERVLVGGFPEVRRSTSPAPDPQQLHLDFVWFSRFPENADADHISFRLGSEDWHFPYGESLEAQPNLSGVSGGPCVRLIPAEERIELAGFVYEAGLQFEVVRVRQASLISAEGKIAPAPIGWTPAPRRPRR